MPSVSKRIASFQGPTEYEEDLFSLKEAEELIDKGDSFWSPKGIAKIGVFELWGSGKMCFLSIHVSSRLGIYLDVKDQHGNEFVSVGVLDKNCEVLLAHAGIDELYIPSAFYVDPKRAKKSALYFIKNSRCDKAKYWQPTSSMNWQFDSGEWGDQ